LSVQQPASKITVFLSVWDITFDLSGMEDPDSSYSTSSTALRILSTTPTPPLLQSKNVIRGGSYVPFRIHTKREHCTFKVHNSVFTIRFYFVTCFGSISGHYLALHINGLEKVQGGSDMTGTNCDLFTHNQSRSYLNHLEY
jgi:hypothetical protein